MLGGLWGRVSYDWLFVELLFVPEAARGADLGTALLAKAEEVARARGCVGIRLDTYSFQAPDFYRRLGFEIVGSFPDYPKGYSQIFLRKPLKARRASARTPRGRSSRRRRSSPAARAR